MYGVACKFSLLFRYENDKLKAIWHNVPSSIHTKSHDPHLRNILNARLDMYKTGRVCWGRGPNAPCLFILDHLHAPFHYSDPLILWPLFIINIKILFLTSYWIWWILKNHYLIYGSVFKVPWCKLGKRCARADWEFCISAFVSIDSSCEIKIIL